MATNETTVSLKVIASGIKEATADAQKLHNILAATAKIASTIRVPMAVQAAQAGVAAAQSRPRAAAAAPATELGGTSIPRSIGPGTGSDSRDFAKQAQGLGGLVHVYATFAANAFAASAAFTALSKAADTTNIVKGLDQLGAASGVALGTLSKKLVEASDGALSLKDAMTSTALASSGGMTSAMIVRMTEVAKKASLALGRDMSDSMDRLTKGIVKIQPELLDELGIMTRVIPAQEAYAMKLGKTASALTDFEKRQAFANAVLEEGERKFSNIDISANPYSKLSASLANLAQSGLSVINTVLNPLVSALSSSPTALTAAVLGVTGILLKQAIPALGQYRKNIEEMRNESLKKVTALASEATQAGGMTDAEIGQKAKKEFLLKTKWAEQTAEKKIELEKRAADIAQDASDKALQRGQMLFGHENNLMRIKDRAVQEAAQAGIKYSTQEIQSKLGVAAAWRTLNEQIALSKAGELKVQTGTDEHGVAIMDRAKATGVLTNSWTRFTGVIGIATTAVTTLGAAFSVALGWIGVIITAVSILSDIFSKNEKEIAKFNQSLESTRAAGDLVVNTIENINKKDFFDRLSVSSVLALSNALGEVSLNLSSLVSNLDKANVAAGGFDRFIDGWLIVIGKDLKSKFSKELAFSISSAIKAMPEGDIKDNATEKITKLLGISDLSFESMQASINTIDSSKIVDLGKRLSTVTEEATKATQKSAEAIKALSESFDKAIKASDDLFASLRVTDPLYTMGAAFVDVGSKMEKAFEDPKNALISLNDIIKDTRKLSLLDPKSQEGLLNTRRELEKLQAATAAYDDQIKKAKEDLSKLPVDKVNATFANTGGGAAFGRPQTTRQGVNATIAADTRVAQDALKIAQAGKIATDAQVTKLTDSLKVMDLSANMVKRGYELMFSQLETAIKQAAITINRAAISGMSGAGSAAANAELKKQELNIQLESLKVTQNLVEAQILSKLAMDKLTVTMEEQIDQADLNSTSEARRDRALEKQKGRAQTTDQRKQDIQAVIDAFSNGLGNANLGKLVDTMSVSQRGIAGPGIQAGLDIQRTRTGLFAQQKAAGIEGKQGSLAENLAIQERAKAVDKEIADIEARRVGLLSQGSDIINADLLTQQLNQESISKQASYAADRIKLADEIIKQSERLKDITNVEVKAAAIRNLQDKGLQLTEFDRLKTAKEIEDKYIQQGKIIKNNLAIEMQAIAEAEQTSILKQAISQRDLDINKSSLEAQTALNSASESYLINKTAELEKQALLLDKQNQLGAIGFQLEKDVAAVRAKRDEQ